MKSERIEGNQEIKNFTDRTRDSYEFMEIASLILVIPTSDSKSYKDSKENKKDIKRSRDPLFIINQETYLKW